MKKHMHPFFQFLLSSWNASQIQVPVSDSDFPIAFAASTPWMNIFCCQSNVPKSSNRMQIQHFLLSHQNALLVFIADDSPCIDLYAQSALDQSPIIVHDLLWNNNDDFINLINLSSYFEFTFVLDQKFGKIRLQKKFVSCFKKYCQKLAAAWINLNDDSPELRSKLALTTLLRLFFVAFLEARGTLDCRSHFVIEQAAQTDQNNQSVYRDFIQPLFFETLNRSPKNRTKRARRFGKIPFLNGGLFTPTPDELNSPLLNAPNELWLDMISNLFEQYSLTTDHTQASTKLSLDPMMLGHVFESLMSHSSRSASGSFYTPMPLALQLTQDALQTYLFDNFNISPSQFHNLLHQSASDFSPELAQTIDAKLADISILDPAAGSGAFLQCALHLLHQIRFNLKSRLNQAVHSGQLARQILANNLYGVDIIPTAQNICELRLWLELIHYFSPDETLPSLPNLDLNIQCGNSLIDMTQYAHIHGFQFSKSTKSQSLTHLKHRYKLSNGYTKKKLAMQINEQIISTEKHLFTECLNAYKTEYTNIQNNARSLFDDSIITSLEQKKRLSFLKDQLSKLKKCINSNQIPGFSFNVHFSDIIEHGGFDIVLGNPPWFPIHTMPYDIQEALKILYKSASHPSGNSSQAPDISSLFIERALQCTKSNGLVNMLVPNKLFFAPSYASFRNYIQNNAQIINAKDWSNEKHNAFAAATYPAALMLKKSAPNQHPQYSSFEYLRQPARPDKSSRFTPIKNAKYHNIGSVFSVKRGICTGANALFIAKPDYIDQSSNHDAHQLLRFSTEISSTPIETDLIHPVIRGSDLASFEFHTPQNIVFTHDWNAPLKPLTSLPPLANQWFSKHIDILSSRKSIGRKPVYSIFGASPHLKSMKVVWRDISKNLEACFINDINVIPLNTVYYIPVPSENIGYLLSAYLNSNKVRDFCRNTAEHAQNDYRRYFAWVIEKIPWIFTSDSYDSKHISELIRLSKLAHTVASDSKQDILFQINQIIDSLIPHPIDSNYNEPSLLSFINQNEAS